MKPRSSWAGLLLGGTLALASCAPGRTTLEIGLFAGNTWGVPSVNSYRFIDSAIAAYQTAHPGVKISYRSGTLREDYSEWLAQKIVKGTEPDLFVVLTGDFNTFASIGALEDLDPWIDQTPGYHREDFYGSALESGQFEGRQYALPLEVVPNLMFVNTTLLKDLGIPQPREGWTWNDFYKICQAVTRNTDGDRPLDRFGANRLSWRSFSVANGQLPLDASGTKTYFGSANFAETVAFIARVQKLNANREVPGFESGRVAFAADLWSSFRAYRYYPYRVNRFSQFQWEALPMPRGPHGQGASELSSYLLSVSHRSVKKSLAWDFLRFLTGNLAVQENLVRYSYGWPVLKAASKTGLLEATLKKNLQGPEGMAEPRVIDSIIENATVTPRFRKFDQVMAVADRELYRIVDDPYDLEGRLGTLDRQIRDILR